MTTDSTPSVTTNGASHEVPGVIAYTDYPARSSAEIEPGMKGSIPYRLRRAASIVDVIAPPGSEIVSAAFGRRRVKLQDSQTIHDALQTEPCEMAGGTFCVLGVRNTSDKAKRLEISLRVTNEHGPEVEDQSPFNMSGGATGKSNGASKPRSKTPTSSSSPRSQTKSPSTSTKSSSTARGGSNVRRSPLGVNAKRAAKAAEAITVPAFVQPPPESKVIVLSRAYVATLNTFFKSCAAIGIQQRPMITHRLSQAHRRAAGAPASLRMGEIAIVLPAADVERLYRAIQRSGEYRLRRSDNASRIHAAIKKALTGSRGDVVVAPTKTLPQGDDLAAQAAIADD